MAFFPSFFRSSACDDSEARESVQEQPKETPRHLRRSLGRLVEFLTPGTYDVPLSREEWIRNNVVVKRFPATCGPQEKAFRQCMVERGFPSGKPGLCAAEMQALAEAANAPGRIPVSIRRDDVERRVLSKWRGEPVE